MSPQHQGKHFISLMNFLKFPASDIYWGLDANILPIFNNSGSKLKQEITLHTNTTI